MEIRDLLSKPVWQMTGEEFIFLNRHALQGSETKPAQPAADKDKDKKYVYGIGGIARLFGCSIPTANRIKKSGRIDRAITQIGRKIIVDADMALELAGRKSGRIDRAITQIGRKIIVDADMALELAGRKSGGRR